MQGIYNYIPERNHVSRVYSVAAVLYLEFVLHIMLFHPWNMFCTLTLQLSIVCVQCTIWLFIITITTTTIAIIIIIIIRVCHYSYVLNSLFKHSLLSILCRKTVLYIVLTNACTICKIKRYLYIYVFLHVLAIFKHLEANHNIKLALCYGSCKADSNSFVLPVWLMGSCPVAPQWWLGEYFLPAFSGNMSWWS